MKRLLVPTLLTLAVQAFCPDAHAGAYVSGSATEPDARTHARNFSGSGGAQEPIRVCVDLGGDAALAIAAEPAVLNVIDTINTFRSLARNTYALGADTDVPAGQYDFESALLHEMLHVHGLAHPNHADESGLTGDAYYGTKSLPGANGVFNQAPGADGIHGSADDVRGDDVNLHWYQRNVNNPGVLPDVVDNSTMVRALTALPAGQLFAANGTRAVLAALGFANAEAAAVQGARPAEAQRHLQHDDIATLRLARAGVDGVQGTGDDYTTKLVYIGRYTNPAGETCQVPVRFDNTTAFASTSLATARAATNNWFVFGSQIRFNPAVNWYMTPRANTVTTIVSDLPDASTGTQPVTVRVNVAKAAGNAIAANPLGVVEVRDGPREDAGTAYCTITLAGTTNETGECQLVPNRGGRRTLTAEYLGYGGFDGSHDTEEHTVTGNVQFSAITTNSDPVAVGAPLDVQWTLGPPFGAQPIVPTGTVVVKDAPDCASPPSDPASQCSVALPGNHCSLTFNTVGTRDLKLCYAGDGAASPASASIAQGVVDARATTTSIVEITPANPAPFAPMTVKIRVDETPSLGGQPKGKVEVLDGPPDDLRTARCTVTLEGTPGEVGQCTLVPTDAGLHNVVANFAVQNQWAASSATTPVPVTQLRIARVSPNVVRTGQGAWVMVDFQITRYLETVQSGYVDVTDGTDFCRVYTASSGGCLWTSNVPGQHNLVAKFSGNGNFPARESAPVTVQVVDPKITIASGGERNFPDANGASSGNRQSLSADGRYVLFLSDATNFVPGDTNGLADLFVRDAKTGLIRRVNTSSTGEQANGSTGDFALSGNGRYVVFSSLATNLVPNDTNGVRDVFVKDLVTDSTVRVSMKSDGSQSTVNNEFEGMPVSISADGRYVAFLTFEHMIPRDTNIHNDVYVKDMVTGELDLVSTAADESLANFRNHMPYISANGRYVAFASQASNFVPEDTDIGLDVYVKDRVTRQIRLASAYANGTRVPEGGSVPVVSNDGRYVAFESRSHDLALPSNPANPDVYIKDLQTGAVERAQATGNTLVGGVANAPAMTPDGRYVVFQLDYYSAQTGLVTRLYKKDRTTGELIRLDRNSSGLFMTSGGSYAPSVSDDGRFISFHSPNPTVTLFDWNNLTDMFVYGDNGLSAQRAALDDGERSNADSGDASISRDGSKVLFTSASNTVSNNDANGVSDAFLYSNGTTTFALPYGTASVGQLADSPVISADNAWVAFRSTSTQFPPFNDTNGANPDVVLGDSFNFVFYRASTDSSGAQPATGTVLGPVSVNANASLIVFRATDTTLTPGDANGVEDVFMKNRGTNATTMVSTTAAGVPGNGHSTQSMISDDGSRVVFASLATNFAPDDTNGVADIYVKTLADGSVVRASSTASGTQADGASSEPSISSDGRYVLFLSAATNLVAGDDNGKVDVFLKDLSTGAISRVNTSTAGAQGTGGDCTNAAISGNAQWAGFVCAQGGLVDGVAAGRALAYVKNLQTGYLHLVSVDPTGAVANAPVVAGPRAIANDGRMVFSSLATNLVPGDAPTFVDVFRSAVPSVPLIQTSVTIDSDTPDPSLPGQAYTVAVTVTRASGSAAVTGTVTIGDGSTICNATLSGSGAGASGSCALTSATAGTKTLTASYGGSATYAASIAATTTHTVVAPAAPTAPFIGTVTRGAGQVSVSFLPPADPGTSAVDGYTADCAGHTATDTGSPIVVGGLTNGVPVTCRVRAHNAVGYSPWSADSASVTPAAKPTSPRNIVLTPGNASVSVAFDAPLDNGGSAVIGYTARCLTITASGTTSPIVVTGLTNGTSYVCGASATNEVGTSNPAFASGQVVPSTVPGAPTGVVATRGNGQVSVAFAAPASNGGAAITGYTATCGSGSQGGTASPLVVSGLANGTTVSCTVTATNLRGIGAASAPSNPVTPATVPDAPTNVVATRGNAQVSVAFTAPNNGGSAITNYTATCGAQSSSGTSSPVVVSGLANGTAVSCTVRATNDVGDGATSAPSNAVTPATVPDAPTNAVATRGNAQASVAFTAPANNGGATVTGFTATCGSASQSGTASPIVVTGLANGTAVTCTVTASNDVGASTPSTPSNSVTPATVPDAPTGVVATRGNAQVSVAFVAPANNGGASITSYTATCGSATKDGTASPLVVTGLANGTPVSCTVKATNEIGAGTASAPSNTVTPAAVPDAPTGVVATRGNAQVSVAFVAPAGNGGSAVTGYAAICGAVTKSGTASPIVVNPLPNGTPVSCTVTASNDVGAGTPSSPSNTVTPATTPAAPTLASAAGTPNGQGAVLTFTAPGDNGGSAITGYDASCTPGTHTVSGTASPLTVTGLAAGTAYTCTVTARNDVGAGTASNGVNVTPRIQADISITNGNGVSFISGGATPGWLIDVENATSTAVTGARVRTTLPSQLTNIVWVCSVQGGAQCPAASGSGSIDGLVNLPAGSRASFMLTATVPRLPEQSVSTTATVTMSASFEDPQPANNTATDGPDTVGIFRGGFDP